MGIYIRFRHGKTALYHILEQQKFVVSALFYGKISRISHSRAFTARACFARPRAKGKNFEVDFRAVFPNFGLTRAYRTARN
jgi:hypothetical protein